MKAFFDRIYVPFLGEGIPEWPSRVFIHIDPIQIKLIQFTVLCGGLTLSRFHLEQKNFLQLGVIENHRGYVMKLHTNKFAHDTLLTFSALLFLAGCDSSYDEKVEKLSSLVERNQMGGTDYFLEKEGEYFKGEWFTVGLIFGVQDDYHLCVEIKDYLEGRYPFEHYRCRPGN